MEKIRVLVADDDAGVVDVLKALIQSQDDLRFVGFANDTESAIALAVQEQPDVALVDVRMPGGGGIRAAREISRRCPPTKVIALTAHEDEGTVIAMMAAGANAYVPKGESTDRILREIHRPTHPSEAPRNADAGIWAGERSPTNRRPGDRRREQQRRIRDVLDSDAVSAVYRAIYDVRASGVVGMSARARVARLPMRGADAWLAEAEAVGLLEELELAAFRAAIRDAGLTPSDAFIVVPVSPASIVATAYLDAVRDADPERIVLEVTEHAQFDDYQRVNDALAPLRTDGMRLCVSDVGAGLASLRNVAMLSPDFVVIDTALTDTVDEDEARHAVVAAVVARANQLGASTIATDVASTRQLEELICLGVRLVQGPLLERLGPIAPVRLRALSSSDPGADALGGNADREVEP